MSDDRIQYGLDAYADHLQRFADLAPAAEIRRRAAQRRRNQAAGAAFAAVLIAVVGLGAILKRAPEPAPNPAAPSVSPSPSPSPSPSSSRTSTSTSTVKSDVTQLRQLGIDLEADVLIDIADDGVDHWVQIGANDTVDFTGTAKDASTRMVLLPAPVTARNRVVITPSARPGFCVAATPQPPLALQTCQDGDETQTWQVLPAGDSGQFNLAGPYGVITVDEALVPPGQSGRTGLQTIRFDK
ncbi:hypothetical protein CA850_09875 [Micromonospora echinospora]|uniref:Uncharacterized protein n=1 Tax=Micromonospora echinospora TaxID=1877 RepID=A0A1C4ZL37_MICEC|nr:hypothetical protein [Micromonospora echinospora]OZV81487.1 hypothetical protein CA850_09875 [Micromonospora echinospora]SCF33635.1 hypothetical protein GA0070618_5420 [Micromonospora echinospora]